VNKGSGFTTETQRTLRNVEVEGQNETRFRRVWHLVILGLWRGWCPVSVICARAWWLKLLLRTRRGLQWQAGTVLLFPEDHGQRRLSDRVVVLHRQFAERERRALRVSAHVLSPR
jgi:hypothetical protein